MSVGEPAHWYLDSSLDELLSRYPMPRRALFLDRDGVVNENLGYVHSAAETRWVPGVFELAGRAAAAGFLIVVVTNQAGIARGFYSDGEFLDYTRWVHEQFAGRGSPLAATFYCPHHPSAGVGAGLAECDCRKPRPGMLLAAARKLDLDMKGSMMIGDSRSDMLAAQAAGLGQAFLLADGVQGLAPVGLEILIASLLDVPSILRWN